MKIFCIYFYILLSVTNKSLQTQNLHGIYKRNAMFPQYYLNYFEDQKAQQSPKRYAFPIRKNNNEISPKPSSDIAKQSYFIPPNASNSLVNQPNYKTQESDFETTSPTFINGNEKLQLLEQLYREIYKSRITIQTELSSLQNLQGHAKEAKAEVQSAQLQLNAKVEACGRAQEKLYSAQLAAKNAQSELDKKTRELSYSKNRLQRLQRQLAEIKTNFGYRKYINQEAQRRYCQ